MTKVTTKLIVFTYALIFGFWEQSEKLSAQPPLEALRLELSLLSSQVEELREALLSPDVRSLPSTDTGIALLRLDALEATLRSTVGRLEALEYNLQILERDATNRINKFTLQIEEFDSDSSTPAKENNVHNKTRDNDDKTNNLPVEVGDKTQEDSSETDALTTALANYNLEEFGQAIDKFVLFKQFYPESVKRIKASFYLAKSYYAVSKFDEAAKEFLEVFSFRPSGEFAFEALIGLANSLKQLGEEEQSCLTLEEIKSRFPNKIDDKSDLITQVENNLKCEQ